MSWAGVGTSVGMKMSVSVSLDVSRADGCWCARGRLRSVALTPRNEDIGSRAEIDISGYDLDIAGLYVRNDFTSANLRGNPDES